MSFSGIMSRLQGQPESYDKKGKYKFGRTLGAGTYGVVREAEGPTGKVAVKIILKKNVKGNERMVYDELQMLQRLKHPILSSCRLDKFYIVTELATGGELFERICEQGKFTEKDASQTIKQVLHAVDYLHKNEVVHRDLKAREPALCDRDPILKSSWPISVSPRRWTEGGISPNNGWIIWICCPEIMDRKGHGKPADMWSMGVITYTLLCGYSPFRSENLRDLLEECTTGSVVFHERYWKDVSNDAKDFIMHLILPDPEKRWTSEEALGHIWLSGKTATDHDLLPEIRRAREARAKLKHAILAVSLKKRIAALKADESDSDEMGDAEEGIPSVGGEKKLNVLRERSRMAPCSVRWFWAQFEQEGKEEAAAAEEQELEEARKRSQSQSHH
ncbi:unnamed protein product [Clonostachys rosea f. rosea IK726]|uniref:Uncharacterized protein n=1 Tax=Clonostachys rosea f. rosea IK726 TaxID=1349383 RepID=A0ACA9UKY5_BIOOC|nr:unnamed protein product [Clonostachys rosea f. rosea IK726]